MLGECDAELAGILDKLQAHLARGAPAAAFGEALGQFSGVSGYVYHTVPLALYCWLRSPGDLRRALEEVIALGGDTDTTGAIVGALAGATVGQSGIPADWISGIIEWPRSVAWMRRLSGRLAEQFQEGGNVQGRGPLPFFWPSVIPRNLLFLLVVLAHGFRRLLPPY